MRTMVSYTDWSPCGWYLPMTSPTIRADFLYGRFQSLLSSCMANNTRRCTGLSRRGRRAEHGPQSRSSHSRGSCGASLLQVRWAGFLWRTGSWIGACSLRQPTILRASFVVCGQQLLAVFWACQASIRACNKSVSHNGTMFQTPIGGSCFSQRSCSLLQRNVMKLLNRIAIALAAALVSTVGGAGEIHNWRSSAGDVWKNRTNAGAIPAGPATAAQGCDGWIALLPRPCCRLCTPPRPGAAPSPHPSPPRPLPR